MTDEEKLILMSFLFVSFRFEGGTTAKWEFDEHKRFKCLPPRMN